MLQAEGLPHLVLVASMGLRTRLRREMNRAFSAPDLFVRDAPRALPLGWHE